jgi:hypothetical protein
MDADEAEAEGLRFGRGGRMIRGAVPPGGPDSSGEPAGDAEPPWLRDTPASNPGDRYRGRRRLTGSAGRRRMAVAAVLAGAALAVAVPLALVRPRSLAGPPVFVTQSRTDQVSADGVVPSAAGTTAASPTRIRRGTPSPSQSVRASSAGSAGFAAVTYEAEAGANTVGGSARVATYDRASGGRIVRNIGNWGDPRNAGTLRFRNVTAPTDGTYSLTFFFVFLDGEASRTAVITVIGADPISVTVAGGSACCASRAFVVVLRKGANEITFGNPAGHAPSIDKIVIGPH